MHQFIVYERGDADLLGKKISANNRRNALALATNMGIKNPVVYLDSTLFGVVAVHDMRNGMLSVSIPENETGAIAYLRHQYGFRQRLSTTALSALWSPEREDGLSNDLGLHVMQDDGLTDPAVGREGKAYFTTLAQDEIDKASPIDAAVIWKRLKGLRTDRNGWTRRSAKSGTYATRWVQHLNYRISFLEALLELIPDSPLTVVQKLRRGMEVLVQGEWHTILRVNEFTVKIGPMDATGGKLVGVEEITSYRNGSDRASKPVPPDIKTGDHVRHRGRWYRVRDVGQYVVTVSTPRGDKRIDISPGLHVQKSEE